MTEQGRADVTSTVGIVADDLTGATDSAVQFAGAGWTTRLALTMPAADSVEPGSVTAFVTDARAQDPEIARANTAAAVKGLRESGIGRLFLKIDSTLRGSVIDQINGALDAWSIEYPDAIAIVCSAYPAMGRTIEDGHILVHGDSVHTTSIGSDPVTPVTTSDVAVLLPGSVGFQLGEGTAAENAARLEAAARLKKGVDGSRVISVDATSDVDLARLAEAIALLGAKAIPTGAAGLAIAMSRVWAAPHLDARSDVTSPTSSSADSPRVMVVVSSLHDVSRSQADELMRTFEADQVRTFAPPLNEAISPTTITDWTRRELENAPALPGVVVISSPSDRPSRPPAGATSAAELIAESLASITELVFEHDRIDVMMLLGGEGARAVLERLGAEALLVHDTVREGIPRTTLEGGTADGVTVVTKAGGFGSPTAVADIVAELIGVTPARVTPSSFTPR